MLQYGIEHTVLPKRPRFNTPHQTEISAEKQEIQQKGNNPSKYTCLSKSIYPVMHQCSCKCNQPCGKEQKQRCPFGANPIKSCKADTSVFFLRSPSRSQGQINQGQKIQNTAQNHPIYGHAADGLNLLILPLIRLKIIACHIAWINGNCQGIISLYGHWKFLQIAADFA